MNSIHVHIGSHTHVRSAEILYCEGYGNYSRVHFTGGHHLTVATTLRILEARLVARGFYRISRSLVINTGYVHAYDSYEITLTTGQVLPIARRRRVAVRRRLYAGLLSND